MLSKLLKYDLQWLYKSLIIFYFFTIIFAISSHLFGLINNSLIFSLLTSLCNGISIILMISTIIYNIICLWIHFIKNIYKEESYLTHTLPVSKTKIFLAKIFSSIITLLTSIIIVIISIFICYYSNSNLQVLENVTQPISSIINVNSTIFIIFFIILIFIEILYLIISGYLGIIIGFKSNNHKIIKSIVYGYVIYQAISLISLIFLFITALLNHEIMNLFKTTYIPSANLLKFILISIFTLYVIFIFLYSYLGNKLIKHGVNIE